MSFREAATRVLGRPGRKLLVGYTLIPVALFGIPAAVGIPWLVGDNLIQNYPLRVLVGIDLRHAHLPLWNPYIWSGSPLLAGFNAGAAYPSTALFAIFPNVLAWFVNQALVYVIAAAGMLALMRVLGRSWIAAGLAAGVFSYGGFMALQSVHIDLVQAGAWLPWAFVALDRLAHRPEGRSPAPWIALLGVSVGLMALTGAVEPLLDGALVLIVFAIWLLLRTPHRRVSIGLGTIAGGLLAFAISAMQILPGMALQAHSQRSSSSYVYFASGSMNKSLTLLGLDPTLMGGAHAFPLGYYGTYNLPEISSYIGIMAVMGLFGLLARRHWLSADARSWRIWYLVLAIGLITAWGNFTPVGHLLFEIPIFNHQRLLSRSLLEVDLAGAVLFGIWIDRMFVPAITGIPLKDDYLGYRWRLPKPLSRLRVPKPGISATWSSDVVLPLVPVVLVVGLQILILAGGTWLPHFLHAPGPVTRKQLLRGAALLTIPSAIALAAGWLLLRRYKLGPRLVPLLSALVAVDLIFFNVVIQTFPEPESAVSSDAPWANQFASAVRHLGTGPAGGEHRFALYNPDRFDPLQVDKLGPPDMNILRNLDSVQGYGALVDNRYNQATGTHMEGSLAVGALKGPTFARLDLGLLATLPEYFLHLIAPPPDGKSAVPMATDRNLVSSPSTVFVTEGEPRTEYFGIALHVTELTVPLRIVSNTVDLRVGLLEADGTSVEWMSATAAQQNGQGGQKKRSKLSVKPDHPTSAIGVVFSTGGRVGVGRTVIDTSGQGTYRLNGILANAVSGPRWKSEGEIGIFPIYSTTSAVGRAWIQPIGTSAKVSASTLPVHGTTASSATAGSARIVSDSSWGEQSIEVTTPSPTLLVRSVGYDRDWRATIASSTSSGVATGPSRSVSIIRSGVEQSVEVPAGRWLVDFNYEPSSVTVGLLLT
ncbi:MAG TPA: hypothetical protein VEJ87_01425, partial [Acidimicrobiales bacterium]|nr:hypothetical protein [Acidimicrobiales bacterium]